MCSEETTQEAARVGVEEALSELVNAHYLERAPQCNIVPTPDDLGPMARGGKGGRGGARIGASKLPEYGSCLENKKLRK